MIPAWLRHNWGLKAISFVLAVGLWYYAVGEENIEVTRVVPLKITLENEQMTVSDVSARVIEVTLSAPRALIVNLASQGIQVEHQISKEIKTAGEYSFRVEPSEIQLPSFQVRVISIRPASVTVKLDELIAQKLEIQPDFKGEPAIGYKLLDTEVRVDPTAILAQGPKGVLEKMTVAKTSPIDLVGRIRSFHRTVEVLLPASVKPMGASLIEVYIPLREEFDEKEFKDVPVSVLRAPGTDGDVKLDPDKVNLVLKGSKRYLEKLVPEKILAYIDLGDSKTGEHELPLQVVLPETVSLKEKQPIQVKVKIRS